MKLTQCLLSLVSVFTALTVAAVFPPPANAQTNPTYERGATQVENILPSAPDAASVARYAGVPFNHSTGAAEYEVPLYTLQGRQLSIPIALRYHSNGIRMDDIAGVAGLGWTLEAGGCISREVVFMPDEFVDGSFCYEQPDGTLLQNLLDESYGYLEENALLRLYSNWRDPSSDRYSYSFYGLSGSFIITPAKQIVQLSGDGVQITATRDSDGNILSFLVTGPDGTRYTLSERETGTRIGQRCEFSSIYSGQTATWNATTAWYLSSITSADGTESASFSYADGGTWNRNIQTHTYTVTHQEQLYAWGQADSPVSSSQDLATTQSSHTTKVLSSISLSGFTAQFTYANAGGQIYHTGQSSTNKPYNYPKKLSQLRVTAPGGRELVRAQFSVGQDTYDGRYLLNGVNIYHGNQLDDRWNFTYNTASHTVNHFSQDWYGYFNGECGDGEYTMYQIGTYPDRTNSCPFTVNNSQSYAIELSYGEPNSTEAVYMSLKSASHDGAVTEYQYEGALSDTTSLSSNIPVGIRVKKITVKDGNTTKQARSFSYYAPCPSVPVTPNSADYITLAASQHYVSVGQSGITNGVAYIWAFTLHDSPVLDGLSLTGASISYGKVTGDNNDVRSRTERCQDCILLRYPAHKSYGT